MAQIIDNLEFEKNIIEKDGYSIVDFFATWCGPCKMLAPLIDELADELSDIPVVKVDIDRSPSLANKYNVRSVPTIVVFKDGVEKDRIIGVCDKDEIMSIIEN